MILHKLARPSRAITAGIFASIAILMLTGGVQAAEDEHSFHRDHVLGTSFDMKVRGVSESDAAACEAAALAEIKRLEKILNSRKPDSEISRLAAAAGKSSFKCSTDLYNVMKACNSWRIKTSGAFNANVGELAAMWKAASKSGQAPAASELSEAAGRVKKATWRLDSRSRTFKAYSKLHLMTDGLAKGYIIDMALLAARKQAPQAKGLLVDIGGDIATWSAGSAGEAGNWSVCIADPSNSADNAEPMATLTLANRSVATSGSYARNYKIGDKRHSQIIDPRTGRPADGVISATVIAGDTATADALATAMCVLGPTRGLSLANRLPGVECLIVDAAGKKHRSRKFLAAAPARSTGTPTPTRSTKPGLWPDGNRVTIGLTLRSNPPSKKGKKKKKKYHRPYVAVMIANNLGVPIKTLSLWVERKTKYDKELRAWYRMDRSYRARVRSAVSRGTRGPGAYTLSWDGRDDNGKQVKSGTYSVLIEINREGGSHVYMRAKIKCAAAADSARMAGNNEADGAWVKYGPGK